MEGKMGFSLTGSHVIFFIAAVIAAGAVSGAFIAVTMNVTTSLSERGDRLQEQLDIDFEIINDPENIPSSSGHYLFYLKNIGGKKFSATNETFQLFVDGEIIAVSNYNFSDSIVSVGEVTTIYVDTSEISAGDRTLRVVGPQAVEDEFAFTI
jgi:flagellar protein FlaG